MSSAFKSWGHTLHQTNGVVDLAEWSVTENPRTLEDEMSGMMWRVLPNFSAIENWRGWRRKNGIRAKEVQRASILYDGNNSMRYAMKERDRRHSYTSLRFCMMKRWIVSVILLTTHHALLVVEQYGSASGAITLEDTSGGKCGYITGKGKGRECVCECVGGSLQATVPLSTTTAWTTCECCLTSCTWAPDAHSIRSR